MVGALEGLASGCRSIRAGNWKLGRFAGGASQNPTRQTVWSKSTLLPPAPISRSCSFGGKRVVETFWAGGSSVPFRASRMALGLRCGLSSVLIPAEARWVKLRQQQAESPAWTVRQIPAAEAASWPLTGRDWNTRAEAETAAGNGLMANRLASPLLPRPRLDPRVSASKTSGLSAPGHKTLRGGQWTDAVVFASSSSRPHCQGPTADQALRG